MVRGLPAAFAAGSQREVAAGRQLRLQLRPPAREKPASLDLCGGELDGRVCGVGGPAAARYSVCIWYILHIMSKCMLGIFLVYFCIWQWAISAWYVWASEIVRSTSV